MFNKNTFKVKIKLYNEPEIIPEDRACGYSIARSQGKYKSGNIYLNVGSRGLRTEEPDFAHIVFKKNEKDISITMETPSADIYEFANICFDDKDTCNQVFNFLRNQKCYEATGCIPTYALQEVSADDTKKHFYTKAIRPLIAICPNALVFISHNYFVVKEFEEKKYGIYKTYFDKITNEVIPMFKGNIPNSFIYYDKEVLIKGLSAENTFNLSYGCETDAYLFHKEQYLKNNENITEDEYDIIVSVLGYPFPECIINACDEYVVPDALKDRFNAILDKLDEIYQ